MATSKKSIGAKSSDPTLFAVDTHANLSAWQEDDKGKTIRVTCGRGSERPLATYDPDTRCWKMYKVISLWGDSPSLENLPRSGMTQNGILYERPLLEHLIGENGCSLWPTPTARDYKDGATPRIRNGKLQKDTLGRALGGAPNPVWVEWLMGFPLGWTDLEDSETP